MKSRPYDYIFIAATIGFTVYGQMILKWRLDNVGSLPEQLGEKMRALFFLVFDPAIFSGFVAAFLASLAWMAAISRFDLSHAYPFMSINFIIVLLISGWLFSEPMSIQKFLGVFLIAIGTTIAARG
jgi:uncharacterized membrane protein